MEHFNHFGRPLLRPTRSISTKAIRNASQCGSDDDRTGLFSSQLSAVTRKGRCKTYITVSIAAKRLYTMLDESADLLGS